ncbi:MULTISPECIES: PspC domain-containing protein [Loigolactobacillus]|uniref:Uncharacterized protein n=1 Tax=Loigolactobacillus backii TaxID=375175 RepID=A0A192H2T0_9LACO|nr:MULTISPECIES: PspC domain-containing protein [Loigolactobacillus]ANK60305.1 hypothetical protein AYR52_08620 [Loigolactobacillus backii]ANK62256.1 hypothetical protein AYR53_05385 [Loigolactobacillus backii]ANK65185.1 hypothetical protein AYR54_08020 [Loigolactobacillus backii]ANK67743.1 hypothetical protein AYR55_08625 [Loigolactobacillus backii]ANK70731.1 hypothetical protein AYR56_11605 [Loigolactobacillus backii]
MNKKLTKSNERIISGVVGGIAEYFNIDKTLLRVIYAAATVFTGIFPLIILYIIAALIMPNN